MSLLAAVNPFAAVNPLWAVNPLVERNPLVVAVNSIAPAPEIGVLTIPVAVDRTAAALNPRRHRAASRGATWYGGVCGSRSPRR